MRNFAYAALRITCSSAKVDYLDEELDFFQVKKIEIKPADLNCIAFALLKIKEIRAKEWIFNKCLDSFQNDLFSQLAKWEYRNVKHPNYGDLAVYVGDDGKITHVGYVNSEGL